jgi:hypothetical protein
MTADDSARLDALETRVNALVAGLRYALEEAGIPVHPGLRSPLTALPGGRCGTTRRAVTRDDLRVVGIPAAP